MLVSCLRCIGMLIICIIHKLQVHIMQECCGQAMLYAVLRICDALDRGITFQSESGTYAVHAQKLHLLLINCA